MSTKLQETMKNENDEDFGKVNYSYVSREKVAIFSCSVGENILIVTLPNTINPEPIAKDIVSFLGGDLLLPHTKSL